MKIISNMDQSNEKLKKIIPKKLSKLGNVKIGDILNAKIVEASDNKIIAEVNGKLVILNDLLELNLAVGDRIQLEVSKNEQGLVFTRPANLTEGEFSKELLMEESIQVLKKLDLEINKNTIKIVSFLKENNIKFNKSELENIIKQSKYINKVLDFLESKEINLPSLDINNNLHKELVKLIQMTASGEKIKNEDFVNVIKNNQQELLEISDKGLINLQEINSFFSEESTYDNIILKEDNISLPLKNLDELSNKVIKTLENFKLDELIFLVKEKSDIDLAKVFLTKNFFSDNKTITNSLLKIITIIEDEVIKEVPVQEKNLVLEKIQNIISKVFTEEISKEEFLEDIIKESFNLDKKYGNDSFSKIKDEILFIKKAVDFTEELNEQMNYINFSLMNDESDLRNVELFINKENNRKNYSKKKFKIYISLETYSLGVVKTLIELEKNKLNIKFILKDGEVENKIKKYIFKLEKVLKKMSFSDFNISFSLKNRDSKRQYLLNNILGTIDMRV